MNAFIKVYKTKTTHKAWTWDIFPQNNDASIPLPQFRELGLKLAHPAPK